MQSKISARGRGRWHQAPRSAGLLAMDGHPHAPWVWLVDPPLGRPTPPTLNLLGISTGVARCQTMTRRRWQRGLVGLGGTAGQYGCNHDIRLCGGTTHAQPSLALVPRHWQAPHTNPPPVSSSLDPGRAYLMEQLPALLSSADGCQGRWGTTSPSPAGCLPGRHAACQTSPFTTSQPLKSSHSIDNALVSPAGRRINTETLFLSVCVRLLTHFLSNIHGMEEALTSNKSG
jgi:hypothetical protein